MAKRGFRPDDFYQLRTLGDPAVSPDGSRVAFVQALPDEENDRSCSEIWVTPLDGSGRPRRFTDGPADSCPRWSPDGRYLAYLSTPSEAPTELRLAPLEGGAPRQLGSFPGAVSQPAWSPDSTRLVLVCSVTDPPPGAERSAKERHAPRVVRGLAARFDNVGWYEGRRHLFVVDVASGSSDQITDGDYDDADPSWSPDGSVVAFSSDRDRRRNDRQLRSDLYIVRARGGRPRRLTSGRGRASLPAFSPDGLMIAFAGHDGGESWDRDAHVFTVPTDGGADPTPLAPRTDRPVPLMPLAPRPFAWVGSDAIALLVSDRGSVGVHLARLGEPASTVIVGDDRQVDGLSVTPDGRTVVFTSSWPDSPSECYAAPLGPRRGRSAEGAIRRISDANEGLLGEVALGPVTRATITRPDGTPVEYFLIRPPGDRKTRLPVHLDVHGGPHAYWPAGRFLALHQAIAAAGYSVVLPNPRGSSSYGQLFTEACTRDWGGADAEDILACVDDVIARGLGDSERQFVSGASYGGFMTAWLAARKNRFRAATAVAAVIDQLSMFGTTDIPGFVVFNFGLPWEERDEYLARSPLTYASNISTPMLILHWEGDLRVPISQAEELYGVLRQLGRPVEFVRYPGGAHVSRTPSQAVDWAERLLEWNARHDRTSSKPSGVRRRRM